MGQLQTQKTVSAITAIRREGVEGQCLAVKVDRRMKDIAVQTSGSHCPCYLWSIW